MKQITLTRLLLLVSFALFGCKENNNPASKDNQPSGGKIAFTFDKVNAPDAVKTITTTLSRMNFETISKTIDIDADTGAVILFEEVPVGTWHVKVDAKNDDEEVLYTGEADVIVFEATVSQVNLVLSPVSTGVGSVLINVTWGNVTAAWKDYVNNPILSESFRVSQPKVYFIDEKYYLYYQMMKDRSVIGLATSEDGNSWEKFPTNPIFVGHDSLWDAGGIVPGPIIKINNYFTMYYQGYHRESGQHRVGYAKSVDGIHWERPANNILTVNGSYIFHASSVIKHGNNYFLYFIKRDPSTWKEAIYLAISANGESWEQYSTEPVLKSDYDWEQGGVRFMNILSEDGKYIAVYSDYGDALHNYTTNFGYATSVDGKNWTKKTEQVFNYKMTTNLWASDGISYPFLTKVGNELRVYYLGITSTGEWKIGFSQMQ